MRLLALFVTLLLLPMAAAQAPPGSCVDGLSINVDHDAARVELTWAATAGAASYVVTRVLDGGPAEVVGTLGAATLSFVDHPAPEGVLDYRVGANGVPPEECAAVSAHIGGTPVPPGRQVCASGLVATAQPGGAVQLSWFPVPGAISYDILRAEGDGPLVPHLVRDGSVTSVTDEATVPGVAYRYAVSANGLPAEGVRCEEVTVTAVPFFGALAALALVVPAIAWFVWRAPRRGA